MLNEATTKGVANIALSMMLLCSFAAGYKMAGWRIGYLKAELAEYQKANCSPPMANDAPSSTKWDELYKVPVSHLQCK